MEFLNHKRDAWGDFVYPNTECWVSFYPWVPPWSVPEWHLWRQTVSAFIITSEKNWSQTSSWASSVRIDAQEKEVLDWKHMLEEAHEPGGIGNAILIHS